MGRGKELLNDNCKNKIRTYGSYFNVLDEKVLGI
jgi:hypothetical protein